MILSFVLTLCLAAAAEPQWKTELPPALEQAAREKKLALLDFQAPWCYSCYYMERHVLSGARFEEAARPLVLVKLDVDKEDGHALRDKYAVTMLPTYLLLDAKGREKGRILGEQREGDFIDRLVSLEKGSADDDAALRALRERVKAGDLDALEKALDRPAGCETAYDVENGQAALEKSAAARKAKILEAERAALEDLAQRLLFVEPGKRCADFRSGVEALAGVYEKLGLKEKRGELLARAVAAERARAKTGDDRNRDDNVRFFLELLGDEPRLRSFYKELIAAYPSDFVYPYRYAKWLVERGQAGEALPWAEEADKLCYGANRLRVTDVRARILAALGRRDEALELLRRDAKASRKSFPKEAAALETLSRDLR